LALSRGAIIYNAVGLNSLYSLYVFPFSFLFPFFPRSQKVFIILDPRKETFENAEKKEKGKKREKVIEL
jgi:hypothetical protein